MEFNLNDIITEVQKRPALWDSRTVEYKNKNDQKTAWRSIALSLVGDFVKLGIKEQRKIIERIRQIWYHQKACYMRNPNWKITMSREDQDRLNRLSFLRPLRDKGQDANLTAGLEEVGESSVDFMQQTMGTSSKSIPTIIGQKAVKSGETETASPRENQLQFKEDSDRSFLKSLLPSVKRLNDEEKLLFRMKVLQLMLEIAK